MPRVKRLRGLSLRAIYSRHFTGLIGNPSLRDYLDLFKFGSFKAKKSCHIDDLIRTYEISGLRAESLYTGSKLAALHCFRGVLAKAGSTFRGAEQTEVTNNHFTSLPRLSHYAEVVEKSYRT